MKKNNYLPLLLTGVSAASASFNAMADTRPNIVIIIADDLASNELGCYGGTNVQTPNIDKLASEGMRMTNLYCSEAMSVPIRASMYTGLYPARHGSYRNHKATYAGTKSVTYYMSNLGYRVGRTGKDHPAGQPAIYAFETIPGFTVECTASHPPAATTDGIKAFMTRDDSQPFCLYVCSIMAHAPWDAGDPTQFDPNKFTFLPNTIGNTRTRNMFCNYLGEVKVLDDEVGKVMKALQETGKLDNTLIIFLGEQGPQFPYGKWTLYNYGQHSAFLARYPSKIPAGSTNGALVQYEDLLPTMIDLAGGAPVADLDGTSFLGVLFGEKDKIRDWAYGIHNNRPEGDPYPIRSIQDLRYKLIWNLNPALEYYEKHEMNPTNAWQVWTSWLTDAKNGDANAQFLTDRFMHRPEYEFYDLQNDQWELNNLIDDPQYADRIATMKAELERWMAQQGDPGCDLDNPGACPGQEPAPVSSYEDLNAIRDNLTGSFYLTNDISIPEGTEWIPIGATNNSDGNPTNFSGTINGRGYTIKNLKISNGGNFTGFIGRLTNGGEVSNLSLENVNIKGGAPTGGLTATIFGGVSIDQVSVTGSVTGTTEAGGISGRNNNAEANTITDCYVNANILGTGTGEVSVGGIVGRINGKDLEITNSYIAGTVRGAATNSTTNYVGGLIGSINNNVAGALVKATGTVVLADEITGGVPNLFVGTELNTTKFTYDNIFARNDITLTYADATKKGTGAAIVKPVMLRNPQDFKTEDLYLNTLGWDFESVWQMGNEYPVFLDQPTSIKNITYFSPPKNCNIATIPNGIKIIPLEKLSFDIYDTAGIIVFNRQNVSSSVDVFLRTGVYVVKTVSKGERNFIKVAVK